MRQLRVLRELFFRPFGARSFRAFYPRLAPWALIFRRFAAGGGHLHSAVSEKTRFSRRLFGALSFPTCHPRIARPLRNSCRPLKRTRFIPLRPPGTAVPGFPVPPLKRLEPMLSHHRVVPASLVTDSCAVGFNLSPLRGGTHANHDPVASDGVVSQNSSLIHFWNAFM